MERAQALGEAKAWCEAWNQRDLDGIMRHYADGVELCSPVARSRLGVADGRVRGKASVRAYFARGLTAPALRFEFVDLLLGADAACILYRRESGALVCDCVEYDAAGLIRRVVACYGEA